MSLLWDQSPGAMALAKTASAEPEEPTYYHASPRRLPVGTMLKPPGRWRGNFDESSGDHVYMTPHLHRAEQYHYMLWDQGHEDPHIYEVHPHGPVEPDPEDSEAVRTRHPVEVTYHNCYHDEDD